MNEQTRRRHARNLAICWGVVGAAALPLQRAYSRFAAEDAEQGDGAGLLIGLIAIIVIAVIQGLRLRRKLGPSRDRTELAMLSVAAGFLIGMLPQQTMEYIFLRSYGVGPSGLIALVVLSAFLLLLIRRRVRRLGYAGSLEEQQEREQVQLQRETAELAAQAAASRTYAEVVEREQRLHARALRSASHHVRTRLPRKKPVEEMLTPQERAERKADKAAKRAHREIMRGASLDSVLSEGARKRKLRIPFPRVTHLVKDSPESTTGESTRLHIRLLRRWRKS